MSSERTEQIMVKALQADGVRAERFERALGDLWTILADGEDLAATLQRLVGIATRLFPPGYEASITILAGPDRPSTVATTDPRVLALDAAQYSSSKGPCLEAADTLTPVRTNVDGARSRWPEFAAAASSEGVLGYLSAPLIVRVPGSESADVVGSFNLYSRKPETFDDVDAALLMLFTNAALAAVSTTQALVRARELAEGLRAAMKTRATIDHAIGILMARHHLSADDAFRLLSQQSQNANVKLRDLALRYVETASDA